MAMPSLEVLGTVRADGTLELDEKLTVSAGRVKVRVGTARVRLMGGVPVSGVMQPPGAGRGKSAVVTPAWSLPKFQAQRSPISPWRVSPAYQASPQGLVIASFIS